MPRRCFAVCAHPDDIEFQMAGTMLRLAERGWELHYMTVANGSCGSVRHDAATIAKIREGECRAACKVLGATWHPPIVADLEILYDRPTLFRLASVMREVAPEIVLTHSLSDYMEDHQNAARLAVTAAFSRNMPNFPADPPRPATEQDVAIYHAQPHGNRDAMRRLVRPGLFVDVGPGLERKVAALAEHKSQKEWLDRSQGMDSYLEALRGAAREIGRMSGRYATAEGWRRHNHLGFSAKDRDLLAEELAGCSFADPGYEKELEARAGA